MFFESRAADQRRIEALERQLQDARNRALYSATEADRLRDLIARQHGVALPDPGETLVRIASVIDETSAVLKRPSAESLRKARIILRIVAGLE